MVTESLNRPYAPPGTMVNLLARLRTRNLPPEIDKNYLVAASYSSGLLTRVINTLRFLSLIEDDGTPSESLKSLARSTDDEYHTMLEGILRDAYADLFTVIDPEQDTQDAIINAFRRYEPASQHYRMAVLFLGLCREAGLVLKEEPRLRGKQPASSGGATTRRIPSAGKRKPGIQKPSADMPAAAASPVIWGYFQRLPKPGTIFPEEEQELWLDAMRMAMKLEYRAKPEMTNDDTDDEISDGGE